jgi:G:T-mismatch repair DNA endonuclease (very short patch repair protein)
MKSKLHKRTKKLLKQLFGTTIKEEVNVRKIFKDYQYRNHFYDLVIPTFNIVIECHGEQHKKLKTFGEKDLGKTIIRFSRQQTRDIQKENVAWENGWGYLIIWFDDLPDDDARAKEILKDKIMDIIERIDNE